VRQAHTNRVRLADLLRIGEYRWLWLAEAQSNLGDQLARVALTILVYRQSGSAVLTSSTYALTFLPALLGGLLLSGVADRHPRRTVMVTCDLLRCALLTSMALPHLPIAVLSCLLVLAVLVGSPFTAAQAAVLPDILHGEHYSTAMALRSATNQLAQLAGFAGGGLLIAALGPRPALLIDAASFAASALIVSSALARHQPAPPSVEHAQLPYLAALRAALRLIAADQRLLCWLGLAWLVGLYVTPEGIAAPLATSLHTGSTTVGLIMAAAPTGTALGAFVFIRHVSPQLRGKLVGPIAAATGLPMAAFITRPNAPTTLALLLMSGVLAAYVVEAISSFTRTVPSHARGHVLGLASSGFLVAQGLGLLLAGLVSEHIGPAPTIALSGTLGTALAIPLTISLSNARKHRPDTSNNPTMSPASL
jgi:predicted MFS family arabinose efflux permease